MIDKGSAPLVSAIETVSERKAHNCGKPSAFVYECIKNEFPHVVPEKTLMIGDT